MAFSAIPSTDLYFSNLACISFLYFRNYSIFFINLKSSSLTLNMGVNGVVVSFFFPCIFGGLGCHVFRVIPGPKTAGCGRRCHGGADVPRRAACQLTSAWPETWRVASN